MVEKDSFAFFLCSYCTQENVSITITTIGNKLICNGNVEFVETSLTNLEDLMPLFYLMQYLSTLANYFYCFVTVFYFSDPFYTTTKQKFIK